METIPPRQDLTLPSEGICMTPRHSFCLRKRVLACFDLPSKYVGCIGEDELKVEEEDDDEEPNAY